jgi:hypothetical protein
MTRHYARFSRRRANVTRIDFAEVNPLRYGKFEETTCLALIPLDGEWNSFRSVAQEDSRPAHHRAEPTHLKHDPLQRCRAAFRTRGNQLSRLVGQIHQDCPRFERREWAMEPS